MSGSNPHTPEAWGAASRGYGEKVAPRLMRPYAMAMAERLGLAFDAQVLEVAAGTGVLTEVLAPRVGSVLATDFSPGMLAVAQERLAAAGVDNVRFAEMNGMALDVETHSFDAAACCFALMLFPDRGRGFAELHRAVRPGGRVAVTGWAGPDRFQAFGIFLAGLQRAFPDMPPPPGPPPVFSLADLGSFSAEMSAAGFKDVHVEYVAHDLVASGADDVWDLLTVGAPPVKVLFDRVGPAGRERLEESVRAVVRERFGDGEVRLTNHATMGVGIA